MERKTFVGADGKQISLCVWDAVENPVGVLQIVHGMAEHVARYDEFARYLNARGIIVAGDDHRAHGETDPDALGLAGDGDLFEKTVADERGITDLLIETYNLPLVLFGHSYGSFLTQRYLTVSTEKLAGVVLCGSAFMTGLPVKLGAFVAKRKCKKHKDEPGDFFAKLTFESYDKKLKSGANGWLNRDKTEVKKFDDDPKCGFKCSNGFYRWFFKGMRTIEKDKLENVRKDLPMLIISGSKDYVGGCGKLVRKLGKRYVKHGLDPTVKLYEGARHELTLETCRTEVFEDVEKFVGNAVKGN